MFRVLTVERECGAGGTIIAQRVAEILGWKLLDRALIGAVAQTAHVDAETVGRYDGRVDSWWRRFHRGGLRAVAIQAGVPIGDAEVFSPETVASVARRVIVEASEAGNCVIVGRGAQCVLQEREDVCHVLICGPWRERVSRARDSVRATRNIGEWIQATDQERASYLRTYYGCDWKDPHLYHMTISSQIGIENAACLIVEAVLRGGQIPDQAA